MKPLRLGATCLLMVLAISCSGAGSLLGVKTFVDDKAPFPSYKTWAWLETKGDTPAPSFEKGIRSGIAAQLSTRGLTRAEGAPPDLLVAYHLSSKEAVPVDTAALGYDVSLPSSPAKISPVTLLVDIVDARGKKLVWRGTAEGNLTPESLPEEKLQSLDDAIDHMFASFPIPHR